MPEVLTRVDPDDSIQKLSGRKLDAEVALRVMGYYWGPITSAAFKKEFPQLFNQQFELRTPLGSYWYLPKTTDWVKWKAMDAALIHTTSAHLTIRARDTAQMNPRRSIPQHRKAQPRSIIHIHYTLRQTLVYLVDSYFPISRTHRSHG